MTAQLPSYQSCRSLVDHPTSEAFDKALRLALTTFEPLTTDYGRKVTAQQREAIRAARAKLNMRRKRRSDPIAKTAIEYAAIIEHSLTPKEAGERLGVTMSCIRRMVANRSLYSFLINRTRYIPDFQFTGNRLIPGIDKVNQALDPEIHPVGVHIWLHYPNIELYLNDDIDQTISPLEWLKRGEKTDLVEQLARRL